MAVVTAVALVSFELALPSGGPPVTQLGGKYTRWSSYAGTQLLACATPTPPSSSSSEPASVRYATILRLPIPIPTSQKRTVPAAATAATM